MLVDITCVDCIIEIPTSGNPAFNCKMNLETFETNKNIKLSEVTHNYFTVP